MKSLNIRGTVDTLWLANNLDAENLKIVDATWYMPGSGSAGGDDYLEGHIPGAVHWDLDVISETDAPLPVTIPSAEDFDAHMSRLGIGSESAVVVYDGSGIMSAARVWWMLRYFGHDNVAVLDGGMPKWKAEGQQLERGQSSVALATSFVASPRPELFASLEDMLSHVSNSGTQIVDARGASRFRGEDAETRPNTRAGHMPGSLNLPFGTLLATDKTIALPDELERRFGDVGLDASKPVAVTCGSGISAAVLALGLFLIGKENVAVYDGSWNEWGAKPHAPVERG